MGSRCCRRPPQVSSRKLVPRPWCTIKRPTSSSASTRSKTGSNNQATKEDWQAASEDDFVKLEPWAVPCSNKWMKDNWDKWQGYSFYTSDVHIEKCVTVTFQLNMQPVVAFVGGSDLLPGPLAEVNTQVCWPKTQPGGLDLSVLRSDVQRHPPLQPDAAPLQALRR